ncbi:hypothetical protein BC828DRAFT_409187 [Blastocladiella britannica]|nr:hypothetical protein BC828DRAFT_409187 [Blastocladiella britannica]
MSSSTDQAPPSPRMGASTPSASSPSGFSSLQNRYSLTQASPPLGSTETTPRAFPFTLSDRLAMNNNPVAGPDSALPLPPGLKGNYAASSISNSNGGNATVAIAPTAIRAIPPGSAPFTPGRQSGEFTFQFPLQRPLLHFVEDGVFTSKMVTEFGPAYSIDPSTDTAMDIDKAVSAIAIAKEMVAPNQRQSVAANLPHELLAKVFMYLLPCSELHNPMYDDRALSPPTLQESTHSDNSASGHASSDSLDVDPMDVDPPSATTSNAGSDSTAALVTSAPRSMSPFQRIFSSFSSTGVASSMATRTSSLLKAGKKRTLGGVSAGGNGASSSRSGSDLVTAAAAEPSPSASLASLSRKSAASEGRPTRLRPHYRDVHPCLRVCRSWYYAAAELVHTEPVLENVLDFVQWLDCLEGTVQRMHDAPLEAIWAVPSNGPLAMVAPAAAVEGSSPMSGAAAAASSASANNSQAMQTDSGEDDGRLHLDLPMDVDPNEQEEGIEGIDGDTTYNPRDYEDRPLYSSLSREAIWGSSSASASTAAASGTTTPASAPQPVQAQTQPQVQVPLRKGKKRVNPLTLTSQVPYMPMFNALVAAPGGGMPQTPPPGGRKNDSAAAMTLPALILAMDRDRGYARPAGMNPMTPTTPQTPMVPVSADALASVAGQWAAASEAEDAEQQRFTLLRMRPGFAGFAMTRVLRFDRSNHIVTKHMSYRSIVKGSLPPPNQYLRDEHVNRIAAAFQVIQPQVTTLDLRNCAQITDVAMLHLITAVSHNLQKLNVSNCRHVKDMTVRTIARVCDALEELVMRGCGKVGDTAIREVGVSLGPRLKVLDVSGCMRINDPGLDFFAKYSGDYRMCEWEALRLEAAARVPINSAEAAAAAFSGVTPSPLSSHDIPLSVRAASPISRPDSPSGLPGSPPGSPRPGSPAPAFNSCGVAPRVDGGVGGKLTTLCLPGIRRQSRGGLVYFLAEMATVHPHLKTLEFSIPPPPSTSTKSMFSGGAFLFWGLRGIRLTSLTIRDCEFLDDNNIEPIAHYVKHLRSLVMFNCANMTEKSFLPIIRELKHLTTLRIRGAKHLSDAAVAHLAKAPCASKLEVLDLSDGYELSDETMYMLASVVVYDTVPPTYVPPVLNVLSPVLPDTARPVFSSLRHLALENCRRLTFKGVMAVARVLAPYDPPVVALKSPLVPGGMATVVPNGAAAAAAAAAAPAAVPPHTMLPGAFGPNATASSPNGRPASAATHGMESKPAHLQWKESESYVARGRSLVSLSVSGAWEGVVSRASVAYRDRPHAPVRQLEIHLVQHAVRGLMRDEYDFGSVGTGGSPMLWSIMPSTARPGAIWYCRFTRSALRSLLDEYMWIPVPVRVAAVVLPVPAEDPVVLAA